MKMCRLRDFWLLGMACLMRIIPRMSTIESSVSSILLDRVAEWLTNSSLAGDELENIVRGFCERLTAAGLPLARVHLSFSMLHPLYDALSFTWRRASGVTIEGFRMPAGQKPDRFLQSPYYYLLDNNLQHIRRRLMQDGPNEFPIFEDLRKDSITDYLAFVQPFGDGSVQGMMGSWSTDHHTGFSDDMIDALLRMQNLSLIHI